MGKDDFSILKKKTVKKTHILADNKYGVFLAFKVINLKNQFLLVVTNITE